MSIVWPASGLSWAPQPETGDGSRRAVGAHETGQRRGAETERHPAHHELAPVELPVHRCFHQRGMLPRQIVRRHALTPFASAQRSTLALPWRRRDRRHRRRRGSSR